MRLGAMVTPEMGARDAGRGSLGSAVNAVPSEFKHLENGTSLRRAHRTAAAPIARLAATAAAAIGLLSTSVVPASAADAVPTTLAAAMSRPITLPAADGYRDDAVLTVTSDAAITVSGRIEDANSSTVGSPLADIPLTDPEADGTFSGTLTLQALELPAGQYTVRLSEKDAATVETTTPLIIGSGEVVQATLSAPATAFPYKDGQFDSVQAKVKAYDETGTAVPYSGVVQVKSGTKTTQAAIASPTAVTASATVSVLGLPLGAGTVVAKVHGNTGADFTTDARAITLLSTKVASVSVSKSVSTIYPAVDGYRDSGSFTVTPVSSTGTTIPVTGTVNIYYGTKLVKSWALTSSKAKTFTWNGLYGGKLVPGTYTVKVSAKGPEASAKTASTTVNVSKKKLVTKTWSKLIDAADIIDEYEWYGEQTSGCFLLTGGKIGCEGADGVDAVSLYAYGGGKIPDAVRSSVSASVRVTANVDHLDGNAAWGIAYKGTDGKWGYLAKGNSTLGWMSIKAGTTHLYIDFWLDEYTDIIVDQYLVEYRYKVLA
jgi:hypothetical protein